MFCTGGIRCEKASSLMKKKGFKNIYHLQGGILNYMEKVQAEDSLWEGECFVFDDRVALNHNLEVGSYDMCHGCRMPITDANKLEKEYVKGVSCSKCFYENIVGVAAFVGWQCSPILKPLLQQGLSDPEEFVVARCISTMQNLTSLGLLQKAALYELLKDTVAFLIHPNLWIRHSTACLISSAATQLDPIDVVVK